MSSVFIEFPIRYTKNGIAPKCFCFRFQTRFGKVGTQYGYLDNYKEQEIYERFAPADARHVREAQSRYTYHIVVDMKVMSESLLKICDDEFTENYDWIKFIPNDINLEENKLVSFGIGKCGDIWFLSNIEGRDPVPRLIDPTPNTKENRELLHKKVLEDEISILGTR